MQQYYILSRDPRIEEVFDFIRSHNIEFEAHLNRTRFWIPIGSSIMTEFILRFSDCCPRVEEL